MKRIIEFFNPFSHLGDKRYSITFPLITMVFLALLSEFFAYYIAKDPMIVGLYAILIPVICIIYFSFREGIVGGIISSTITILYYLFILRTRHYQSEQLRSGIETTVILALVYLLLAVIIGGLKQIIDNLIEREADEKNRLDIILQQLPVGVIITDHDGKVIKVNERIEKILAKKIPLGHTVGQDEPIVKSMHNNRVVTTTQSPLFHAIVSGKQTIAKEYGIEIKGEKKYISINASPIYNKRQHVIAAASIVSDITEQKILSQRKDDFLNMVSHELKTPLTSLKVFSQILEKKLKEKKAKDLLPLTEKMNKQLGNFSILVSELLDVTRMQRGIIELDKKQFYVRELAEDVRDEIQMTTSHEIILDWKTRYPVYADRDRIRQVLVNLVTNAIKYSSDKSKIILGSRKKGTMLEIFVQDFGVGISKAEQKKIFDRFYQVQGKTNYPGLGLGLYICSQIIRRHKGKLWVKSAHGKGSTFYFRLPIYKGK